MRRTRAAGLLVLLAGVAVAGCGYIGGGVKPYRPPVNYPPPPTAGGGGAADPGRYLFMRDCAYCHGDDGKGTSRGVDLTAGAGGPALVDFVLRTGRMPVEDVVEQMQARKPVYDKAEIDAIVAFVRTQIRAPGPEVPHLDIGQGNLAAGQQVYQEHCASCHATTGIGGAMLRHVEGKAKGVVIPNFGHSDARAIADAVRTGPGSMPVFGERAISDEELNSLVRYVVYLQDPADPGGAPIGRVGPVVEGAVGWLVGLGTLVIVIRWIGTKAGEL